MGLACAGITIYVHSIAMLKGLVWNLAIPLASLKSLLKVCGAVKVCVVKGGVLVPIPQQTSSTDLVQPIQLFFLRLFLSMWAELQKLRCMVLTACRLRPVPGGHGWKKKSASRICPGVPEC
jgi:hypothetical protein